MSLLLMIIGAWLFDAMMQLRWMHQRELAMALGVAMRRDSPIVPVLEGNSLVEEPGFFGKALDLVFPYPFYGPFFGWKHGFRAVLLRAIARARAGDPRALNEPGLLHRDDLLDIELDRKVPGLKPGRKRGGSLRGELANAVSLAVYPLLIALLTLVIASYWLIFISPKMHKIMEDMGAPYPGLTRQVEVMVGYGFPAVALALVGMMAVTLACWLVPRLGWVMPGWAGVISPWGRGRLLESLGLLVRTGRDLPSALEILDQPGLHGHEAGRRLLLMLRKIEEGATAQGALREAGWIDGPQEAWLGLATRSGRFAEALVELGGSLQALAIRRLRWRTTLCSTLGILAVGTLVGMVVVAFFIPLVELIQWMGG